MQLHNFYLLGVILQIIENVFGVKKARKPKHHDLDALSGTWAADDYINFEKNTEVFERVDPELWL